jgi:hypothetical protein
MTMSTPTTNNFCGSRRDTILNFCCVVGVIVAISIVAHAQKTIVIQGPGEIDKITYDPKHFSEQEIRHWFRLSPEVAPFNGYLGPEWLEVCDKSNPKYVACPSNFGSPKFVQNAEVNLQNIKTRIAALTESQFPVELSPVVRYLKSIQRFELWKETQRLKYLKTGRILPLQAAFETIDPRKECSSEIEAVRTAPNLSEGNNRAWHDWGNCVWRAQLQRVGDYPRSDWGRFLKKFGIAEEAIQDNGDKE